MKYSHFLSVFFLGALLPFFAATQSHDRKHEKMHKDTDTSAVQDTYKKAVKEKYVCPMHSEVVSDKPETCPQCGMALKKIDRPKAKKQSDSYVCPMHPKAISDKPGKCPECGMNLVKSKSSPDIKDSHKIHRDTVRIHPQKIR